VKWELDFLYESRPIGKEQEVESNDRELFNRVARMKDPEWPQDVLSQYTETLEAMNRMRKANSRSLVDLDGLEYGGPVNSLWC
jgi:7,8-dihydro-6-hydroxymethylpterin-pyrophosphokinase